MSIQQELDIRSREADAKMKSAQAFDRLVTLLEKIWSRIEKEIDKSVMKGR